MSTSRKENGGFGCNADVDRELRIESLRYRAVSIPDMKERNAILTFVDNASKVRDFRDVCPCYLLIFWDYNRDFVAQPGKNFWMANEEKAISCKLNSWNS